MDMKLADKHALVCASSSGLGYACAAALLKEGASVWINGRNAQRLEAARQRLQAEIGGQVQAVVADITTQEGRAACWPPVRTPIFWSITMLVQSRATSSISMNTRGLTRCKEICLLR